MAAGLTDKVWDVAENRGSDGRSSQARVESAGIGGCLMAWVRVVIQSNGIESQERSGFMNQIEKASREAGLVGPVLYVALVQGGGVDFFLESPLAELVAKTEFTGEPSKGRPPEAERIRL